MEHYNNFELNDIVYFCEFDQIEKTERWELIKDYEGLYEISDLGRVKSLQREINHNWGGKRILKTRIIATNPKEKEYSTLSLSKNNKITTKKVHILVARAFLNHKSFGREFVVDHKNNIKKDNRLINLQIITQQQNSSKDKISNSGHTNISYREKERIFIAFKLKNKKRYYVGCFKTLKEALSKQEQF